jgi:hypothetical protein
MVRSDLAICAIDPFADMPHDEAFDFASRHGGRDLVAVDDDFHAGAQLRRILALDEGQPVVVATDAIGMTRHGLNPLPEQRAEAQERRGREQAGGHRARQSQVSSTPSSAWLRPHKW